MLRHVALFRWQPATDPAEVAGIAAALRRLPAAIPELRDYRVGTDARLAPGNWDFAVVADVDDEAAWRTYVDHPAHQAVAARLRGVLEARAAVQLVI